MEDPAQQALKTGPYTITMIDNGTITETHYESIQTAFAFFSVHVAQLHLSENIGVVTIALKPKGWNDTLMLYDSALRARIRS